METIIRQMDNEHIDREGIEIAGEILRMGGLVAFPTETVYGLGANALDSQAAGKIYAAKGRPSDNPLIVHIADLNSLDLIASDIPLKALELANAFWPGPLTMIFHKTGVVPYGTTGGLDTVAVRMPENPIALEVIKAGGGFIAAPSANTSGKPSPTIAEHVAIDLDGKIDMLIDGGQVGIGLESTIVDMTEEVPTILRPGYINKKMLESVIGYVKTDPGLQKDSLTAPKAPGMKYKHYAPKADLTIIEGRTETVVNKINDVAKTYVDAGKKVGVIATDESLFQYSYGIVKSIGSRQDEESIARNLYRLLREFDEEQVDYIFSEAFTTPNMGQAIMNRLLKAAGHQVVLCKETIIFQKYNRLIFVSQSDIGRGVMAKIIMKSLLLNRPIEIDSRGLIVLFPEPLNQKAEAVLVSKGLNVQGHSSRQLTEADLTEDCLIVAVEEEEKQKILLEYQNTENVYSFAEVIGSDIDIINPYGGPLSAYGECYEVLDMLVRTLVEKFNKEEV